MNHSELSHIAGAVDDSTINIVVVIIIIAPYGLLFSVPVLMAAYYIVNNSTRTKLYVLQLLMKVIKTGLINIKSN